MNYIKKMCILRQIRQGFSGDGKTLSGLIKIEQYGKNLAVEVSVINFAPLISGEYYCLLSDGKGKTEMLTLRGKSLFNLLSDMDISGGFCGIICYVKNEVIPIAYGINGNKSYDWRTILNATLPPVFPNISRDFGGEIAESAPIEIKEEKNGTPRYEIAPSPISEPLVQPTPAPIESQNSHKKETLEQSTNLIATPAQSFKAPSCKSGQEESYDDENVADNNYYEEESDECQQLEKIGENAHVKGATKKQGAKTRTHCKENEDATHVCGTLKTDPDGYYLAVKEEIDQLFKTYPHDKTLNGAFSCSEWVRVKGTAKEPQYLVGVLKMDERVHYICYALRAEDKDNPPEEIKNVCSFVPVSAYEQGGFFVIFQSAANGECLHPQRT